jgi:hypothetical protein
VVDLLVIDGRHTVEAVHRDFSEWFSALSDQGICVIHDAWVTEGRFEVRAVWDQLKNHWPSIELQTSFGLGILFVGSNQQPGIRRFLDVWSSSSEVQTLLGSASELLASTFPARLAALEQEAALRSITGESAALGQRLGVLTAELLQLSALRDRDQSEREQIRIERDQLRVERDQLHRERDQSHGDLEQARNRADRLGDERDQLTHVVAAMRRSTSWRVTAPMRSAAILGRSLIRRGR